MPEEECCSPDAGELGLDPDEVTDSHRLFSAGPYFSGAHPASERAYELASGMFAAAAQVASKAGTHAERKSEARWYWWVTKDMVALLASYMF
jgi:hypothetical protein